MNFIIYISDFIIPFTIMYIVAMGLVSHVKVYEAFTGGAKTGLKVVAEICPTLIGLMVGVGILRESGFLTWLGNLMAQMFNFSYFPAELFPLTFVRLFSSSAATGLALDIFKTYGTDSYIGTVTSIMMSSTETVFYTMAVYFMAAKVTKTRWTLAGALVATFAGIAASIVMAVLMCDGI